jgi:Uma2 family endonuclease
MIQTLTKPLTLDQFLKLPETKPASEFVNGKIIQKSMPQGKHSTLQLDLGTAINTILKPQHIARAYSELRCTFGGKSIVPDISVFTWERIPRDENGKVSNNFTLAPDQSQTKVVRNILHCIVYGTHIGWLVDPEEELIFVYFNDQRVILVETENDSIPVPSFAQNINLTLGQLFNWLNE